MNPARLHAMMSGEDRSPAGRLFRAATLCAEPFYRAAVAARNAMFDHGLRKPKRLPRPVISVGNLTTGGTGKTPMVIELARRLVAMGAKPAVLLRGFRPNLHAMVTISKLPQREKARSGPSAWMHLAPVFSDETIELLRALQSTGDVPVCSNVDRGWAGKLVLDQRPETNCFLLDDGFQHRQLHRDLDLVLIDATSPFGFGHVLPRGMLREAASNLRRAGAVIITRADQIEDAQLGTLRRRVEELSGGPASAVTRFRWGHLLDKDDERLHLGHLSDSRALGVCGVGNPASFGRMLRGHATEDSHVEVFQDHHSYTPQDLSRLMRRAVERNCGCIVTTEKDWVKWKLLIEQVEQTVPMYRPVLGVEFLEGGDTIDAMLRACVTRAKPESSP